MKTFAAMILLLFLCSCMVKIQYGDFSYSRPAWMAQDVSGLSVTKLDDGTLEFTLDRQHSDMEAMADVVKTMTGIVGGAANMAVP